MKEGKKIKGDFDESKEIYLPLDAKESLEMHMNLEDSKTPQHGSGKKNLKIDNKEKNVHLEPTQDIDTSLDRGYNEQAKGRDRREDSVEVEEKIREGNGKE